MGFSMPNYPRYFLNMLFLCIVFVSCSTTPEIKRPASLGKSVKVIIIEFADESKNPGSGKIFTEHFASALTRVAFGKYVQLERRELKDIIDEKILMQSGLVSDEKKNQLRQMTGADAIIIGRVTRWDNGSFFSDASVGFSARCILMGSGEIPWTVSFSDSIARTAGEDRVPDKIAEDAALIALNQIQEQLVAVNP